jgi:hypothetical protein
MRRGRDLDPFGVALQLVQAIGSGGAITQDSALKP